MSTPSCCLVSQQIPMMFFMFHSIHGIYPNIYPLVNIQKTMENHHVQWVNTLFLWPFSIVILTQPEGIPTQIHDNSTWHEPWHEPWDTNIYPYIDPNIYPYINPNINP